MLFPLLPTRLSSAIYPFSKISLHAANLSKNGNYHSRDRKSTKFPPNFQSKPLIPKCAGFPKAGSLKSSSLLHRLFRPFHQTKLPKPIPALPYIWLRLGGDDIEPASPKAIPLSCLCTQFKWKNFPLFCVRFLARKQIIFCPCEKALTPICRRLEGCVAWIGGRVRMGHTKARRNLDAAGRAEQPDRIVITFSELIVLILPPLSSSRPAKSVG